MKSTGIIRRIDDLGRIVIPSEIRKYFGVPEGTPLEVLIAEEGILLKRYDPDVTVMNNIENLEKAVNDNYVELGEEKTEKMRHCIGYLKNVLKSEN